MPNISGSSTKHNIVLDYIILNTNYYFDFLFNEYTCIIRYASLPLFLGKRDSIDHYLAKRNGGDDERINAS